MHDDDKLYKDIIHSQAEMSMKYVGQKLADDEFSKLDNESLTLKFRTSSK